MTELTVFLEAQAQAPEWIRLLPLGEVRLTDGRPPFSVDAASLARLVQDFQDRGLDLVVDYEHQTLTGGKAPAAGWIKDLEARGDGLWARVDWTPTGKEHLENREYRYYSPVLRLNPETRMPLSLLHVALTNTPAISQLKPLVMKEGEGRIYILNSGEEERAAQAARSRRRARALGIQIQEEEAAKMLTKLKALLGLNEDKDEAEVLALADQRLRAAAEQQAGLAELKAALELPEAAGVSEIKGAVLALKQAGGALEQVQQQLAALEAERTQEKAERAVTEALKAGKIQPSQKDWALDYARKDPAGFEAYAANAPKLVPLGDALKIKTETKDGTLDPDALEVCQQLGLEPEAFKAEQERLAQAR